MPRTVSSGRRWRSAQIEHNAERITKVTTREIRVFFKQYTPCRNELRLRRLNICYEKIKYRPVRLACLHVEAKRAGFKPHHCLCAT